MNRRLRSLLATLALAVLLGSACAAPGAPEPHATAPAAAAPGFDEAGAEQTLYRAAQSTGETEVNLYSSINEQEAKPLLDIWNRKFPTIKANYIRASETALTGRILTEEQAGKHNFDVLATSAAHVLVPAGLALNWSPPNAAAVDPDFKDRDGTWVGVYANWNVIQVNTDRVRKGEVKSYEDLLKTQYKGQIIIDDTDYEWYTGLAATRGQQQADELLRKIVAANGVVVIDGHGNVSDKVAGGEYAVALNNYLNLVERAKRQGAPTDWIAVEPVVVHTGKMVVSKNAPHPNAAKLMANFLISAEAQRYLAGQGRPPTRADVSPNPPDLVKGLKKSASPPLVGAELESVGRKFRAIFR